MIAINYDIFQSAFHSGRAFQARPVAAMRLLMWSGLPALVITLVVTLSASLAPAGNLLVSGLQLIIFLPVIASTYTAYLRFLVDGEVLDGMPFRFGLVETKLLGTLVYWVAIALAVFALILFTVSQSLGSIAFLGVFLIPGQFWIAVRTCPILAMSYLDQKVVRLDVWSATRGIFWPTLLSLLVVGLIIWVINIVLAGITLSLRPGPGLESFPVSLLGTYFWFITTGFLLGPAAYIAIRVRDIRSDPSLDPPSA